MINCLDHRQDQHMTIREGNSIRTFQIQSIRLQRFLQRNMEKVLVIESEGCDKVEFFSGLSKDRIFDGADVDREEFIGKISML